MYSALRFTMRTFWLVAFAMFSLALLGWSRPDEQQPKRSSPNHASKYNQRGSKQSPLFVQTIPTPKTAQESAQEAEDRANKADNDRNLVKFTGKLVTATFILAAIGLLQFLVYAYQARQLRHTVNAASEQSGAMQRYIVEAERSATAMENIVKVINFGNHAVMRAYLTVIIGNAIYQERRIGQGDLKFEAKPILVNTGNTPARKIKIHIAADILPVPQPEGYELPPPDENLAKDAGMLGAHLNATMSGVVKDFVPDSEVANIKEGLPKALCVWGFVTYEDMFGGSHRTQFGQWITWLPDGKVWGYYMAGQNDAD